jgi:Putative Ig domain
VAYDSGVADGGLERRAQPRDVTRHLRQCSWRATCCGQLASLPMFLRNEDGTALTNFKHRFVTGVTRGLALIAAVAALAACGGGDSAPAAPSQSAPTISGTPATTATAGSAYSFTPTATHPSGTTLMFSIQNEPTWTAFDTMTGTLSGTPATGNVGTYPNVVISVSDGTAAASLAAFSITVAQAEPGSATVSWTVPTENSDGSTATNLSGFNVYYGTDSGNLSQKVAVKSITQTSQGFSGLASGTWYFAVTTLNSAGLESDQSNSASATVD